MSKRTAHATIALMVSALVAACASGRINASNEPPGPTDVSMPPATTRPDPCIVVPQPDTPRDSAVIVVEAGAMPWNFWPAASDSTARTAASRAAAFVIAQLYQPLIRVACDGRIVSGIADRWSSDSRGREWHFILHEDARFADGRPVTADAVRASWDPRARAPGAVQRGHIPPVGSLTIENERAFAVSLLDGEGVLPSAFGQLALAIHGDDPNRSWPSGSGQFVIDTSASRPGATVLRPSGRRGGPAVVVRSDSGRDHRDLLDSGVDVLQTRDPVALDYARRSGLSVHPLPFDRTYVIAIPVRAGRVVANTRDSVFDADALAFRAALARDAVRTEARAAETPAWWMGGLSCVDASGGDPGTETRAAARTSVTDGIMYLDKDPIARAIAERLVAIARSGGTNPSDRDARALAQLVPELNARAAGARPLTAIPADSAALRSGSAVAYVIYLPARTLARCAELRRLTQRGAWISASTIVPLIDTRSFLIAGGGAPAIVVDWDGTLRIQPSPVVRRLPQR